MNKKDPNPIDAFVGSRVRMRRLMIGLSQEKLADGLGITFQQVQKYEKGTNRIGASRLQAIADILGVHPSFFFQQDEGSVHSGKPAADVHESQEISSFVASKEGIALNRAFLKITDPVLRKKIISLVAAMAQTPEADQAAAQSGTRHAESLHG
ncbi:XRE family transcriptional regulator [Sinorhizobium meliloti]|uniref:helix-turn-helix domain-containing protein n=1 Tax=Rhizobium meliloti TaxID=382 RepID=UPI0002F3CAC4|nr:helix-turn-helix transcriptional regulator [Sinorhizobium meliloti]MDE3814224.1 helix-turn-helix transcriptional regulator [Sinorhizobium meliloti]MDE4603895.1 helix-turn-helix domain-containing protein [Sinorhizobium meliloti]MQU96011.1 helix-turn-helix domain-containing protein [Sinorhizobium meliloti]RVH06112.1 XRE family transcriptional regulator [Sinorhizobium meliloti]RVP11314.1 XRE family transcriptional regulator [Sinorhizobium meliloti]